MWYSPQLYFPLSPLKHYSPTYPFTCTAMCDNWAQRTPQYSGNTLYTICLLHTTTTPSPLTLSVCTCLSPTNRFNSFRSSPFFWCSPIAWHKLSALSLSRTCARNLFSSPPLYLCSAFFFPIRLQTFKQSNCTILLRMKLRLFQTVFVIKKELPNKNKNKQNKTQMKHILSNLNSQIWMLKP